MPLAAWITLGVVAFHVVLFWVVANKHFLPKTRHLPPPPPANFGAGQRTSVDPATGEVTTETQYVISTKLASPAPPGGEIPSSKLQVPKQPEANDQGETGKR